MKLKLIVLAGAKQGLEIPLKKDKFLIGRAKECALRAGSEAISRRHCAIIQRETGWTVRDLGSRNGTLVNDERITKEVPLKDGDMLRVGPLHFRVVAVDSKPKDDTNGAPADPATPGKNRKPPVKTVADVVARTISNSDSTSSEDDITSWLLNVPNHDAVDTLKETRSLRAEDTTINKTVSIDAGTVEDIAALAAAGDDSSVEGEPAEEEGSGVWKFLKRGKPVQKKVPGKLPPRADQQSKDSREAAADILREMQRRR